MDNNKRKIFIIVFCLLILIGIIFRVTYSIWSWNSTVNKNVVFSTPDIEEYIVYDEGLSKFIGNFQPVNTFCESANVSLSFYKKNEAVNVDFKATIKMDINLVGDNIAESDDVYWVVTSGNNTINCNNGLDNEDVLAYGTFNGVKKGQTLDLLNDIDVTLEEQMFTVWIWIDNNGENLSKLSGDTIDTNVWTLITMNNGEHVVMFDVNGGDFVPIENGESTSFDTYGEYEYIVPYDGLYKLEAWGAQGASYSSTIKGGYGGYTSGVIDLKKGENLYVYVGQNGQHFEGASFNGGGGGEIGDDFQENGGGATDFRLIKGSSYSDALSLASRLMVAGGGGSADDYASVGSIGGSGGGLTAYNGSYYRYSGDATYTVSTGATQVSGGGGGVGSENKSGGDGTFGLGGTDGTAAGGGGYYGGGAGYWNSSVVGSGAGGSSFISGHTGCVAITSQSNVTPRVGTDSGICTTGTTDSLCSIHYSEKKFTDTIMIDGNGYSWSNVKDNKIQMPNPQGGTYSLGVGHTGDGYARITLLNRYDTIVNPGVKYGDLPVAKKDGYKFLGWSTKKDDYDTLVTEDSIVSVNSNHTLYALFSPIYMVTFGLNGGEFDIDVETIDYTTVGEQVYTIPYNGLYKLEVWGAQGGSGGSSVGGSGGYSVGTISLNTNQKLYINVGGSGESCGGVNCTVNGGYNGGGGGVGYSSCGSGVYAASGGGATHISTVSGVLANLSQYAGNNYSPILIVAGGGGGGNYCNSENYANGGAGGGIKGVDSVDRGASDFAANGGLNAVGGSQTAGFAFGQGGSSTGSSTGGGGGYYGGKHTGINGAGGGSGYIGNSLLNNKAMYCYNCTTSSDASTLTYSTTNVSSTATSNYAKSGNGAARISLLTSAKNVTYYEKYGELPIPTKYGYTFVGWNTKSDGTGEFINSDTINMNYNEHTLYAIWEKWTFNVLYSVNGGVIDSTSTSVGGNTYNWTTSNDIISLNGDSNFYNVDDLSNIELLNYNDVNFMNISKSGVGVPDNLEWICLEGCSVENSIYSQNKSYKYTDFCDTTATACNIVLGVNWREIYTISYNANNGSGAPDSQQKFHGVSLTLSSTIPTRSGYKFLGWSTSSTATSASYTSSSEFTINDNITLYAVWKLNNPVQSYICANSSNYSNNYALLYYTGNCSVYDDGNGNWRIKFLSSGDLTLNETLDIDVFLVGGGGGSGGAAEDSNYGGGGGGGGYLTSRNNLSLSATTYHIQVGDGGTWGNSGVESTAFGYSAAGGGAGGSNGGVGGANGGRYATNGEDGGYEFNESSSGVRYGGGGGGGGVYNGAGGGAGGAGGGGNADVAGAANTGGGGGGATATSSSIKWGKSGTSGGSGIVIIRNARLNSKVNFTYTGKYKFIEDDGDNWRIKFLTSGNLTFFDTTNIDVFLVGGGGGSAGAAEDSNYGGGGGGGGYLTTKNNLSLSATTYYIQVGDGGTWGNSGVESTAFGYSAAGGGAGISSDNGGVGGANGGRYATNGEDGGYEFNESSSGVRYGGGGGGGGVYNGAGGGAGGAGGGGNADVAGAANTGGGGGGATATSSSIKWGKSGTSGGSGIVIIRNAR